MSDDRLNRGVPPGELARERWRTAGAELARLLRLDPTTLVQPVEPPHLRVTLVPAGRSVDELIPVALRARPDISIIEARPRYYPRWCGPLVRLPGLREVASWHPMLIMRRTG